MVTSDCKGYFVNYSQSVQGYGVWSNGTNVSILNCNLTTFGKSDLSNNSGVMVSGNRNILRNNSIRTRGSQFNYGVFVSASNVTVEKNVIVANGTSSNNHGVLLVNASFVRVLNNTINASGKSGNNGGVFLSSGSGNNSVVWNEIRRMSGIMLVVIMGCTCLLREIMLLRIIR